MPAIGDYRPNAGGSLAVWFSVRSRSRRTTRRRDPRSSDRAAAGRAAYAPGRQPAGMVRAGTRTVTVCLMSRAEAPSMTR